MYRIYDFECPDHGKFEELVEGTPQQSPCPECGQIAEKVMSAPAIHTLETHMRGYRGDTSEDAWTPAHGFRDPNLTDEHGKPMVYSSLSEKRRLLKERGLEQKEATKDWTKLKRSKRPMRFTREGSKRSQLGVTAK